MSFQAIFHTEPQIQASAPGRVNLLGEHTDYNDGFVLPTAIPQKTTVSLGFSPDTQHHIYSQELREWVSLPATDSTAEGFASYLIGCIRVLEHQGITLPPLSVHVTSDVPIGSGLSSSAALEVAMLRGLRALLHLSLTDLEIAQLGQQAERNYAGVQCGIMDQMASSLADQQHLLFLDTRTLEHELLPLPVGAEILILDSGIPRTLAGSGYNQRRTECEAAAQQLGVKALRDVDNVSAIPVPGGKAIAHLPSPLQQRARHVISENQRVLEARRGVSAARFGELMNASHASLRDDYQVSIAGLDLLVSLLQQTPEVFGAKLTGAGFGGACVALVMAGKAGRIAAQTLSMYNLAGYQGRSLMSTSMS